jgi:hypothetical protein
MSLRGLARPPVDYSPLRVFLLMEAVVILIDFGETWTLSEPMPRYVAEHVLADFAHGVAWLDGRHPTGALLIPREERVH